MLARSDPRRIGPCAQLIASRSHDGRGDARTRQGLTPSAAPTAAPRCTGRSAAACGQAVKPLDPPVRHFISEFAQELFDVDSRVLRSFRRLFFTPGFLTREYFAGRRAPLALAAQAVSARPASRASRSSRWSATAASCSSRRPAIRTIASGFAEYGYRSLEDMRAATDAAQRRLDAARDVRPRAVRRLAGRARASPLRATVPRAPGLHAARLCRGVRRQGRHGQPRSGRTIGPGRGARDRSRCVYVVGYTYLALRRAYGLSRGLAVRDTAIVTSGSWLALMVGDGGRRRGRRVRPLLAEAARASEDGVAARSGPGV